MLETLTLKPSPTNPRARVRILEGEDDGHRYEVKVPLRCKTVEDALDWLRPEGLQADAIRQGEFYFVPSSGPHRAAGCHHESGEKVYRSDCGSEEYTDAGSEYRWTVDWDASFSRTHRAKDCYSVVKSGSVQFVGRKRVKSHSFTGRPRYFVRGPVEHSQHGTLELPKHAAGLWYEVVPNRAHGPFPVAGFGPTD